jgi:hypothetical protein
MHFIGVVLYIIKFLSWTMQITVYNLLCSRGTLGLFHPAIPEWQIMGAAVATGNMGSEFCLWRKIENGV